MVFKLDPLDIMLDYERRPYRLGETINAVVTLMAKTDIKIRTASLNLVAEVRRTQAGAARTMDMGGAATLQGGQILKTTDYIPMQQNTQQTTSDETCYSVRFPASESLRQDETVRHSVDLLIGPELPKVAIESKELERDANNSLSIEQWWLETQVDVVMGIDQSHRKKIDISLS